MASKMKTSSVDVVNAVRASMLESGNTEYTDRIPEATRYNLAQIGEIFKNDDNLANQFLHNIVNRIAFVWVKSRLYKNPLSEFKRGELGFGVSIEEVFVQIAKAHHYNPAIAEQKVFAREIPDVKSAFHTLNRQDFYKVTIQNNDLYNAFLSENGVTDMIGRIVDSLYSGDNYDEFLIIVALVAQYIDNNETYDITVPALTSEANVKRFLVKVRSTARMLSFMSTKYNPMGVATYSPMEDLVIIMTPETQAEIDVEALAGAFNMNKAEIENRIVIIDSFGDSPKAQSTLAFITDKDFFVLYDKLIKMTEIYNSEGLYWNYCLHHWELMSTSKFSPVVRLTTDEVADTAITSLTLTPETATVVKGGTVMFTPTLTGTGNFDRALNWTVSGTLSAISSQGVLVVNPAETEKTLTVTCTSIGNSSVSATATVTVKDYFTGNITMISSTID